MTKNFSYVPRQSKLSWMFNGVVLSVLTFASATGVSLFVRSGGWHPLIDNTKLPQAIGFPFEIWKMGTSYGNGAFIDYHRLLINGLVSMTIGIAVGVFFVIKRDVLNSFMQFMVDRELNSGDPQSLQYSLGGLIVFTSIASVIAATIRASLGASPTLLMGIYLFGPAILVLLAMIPNGLSWQSRIVLLTPSTLLLIGFTMFVGHRLELPFDIVMLGIFACWVPQSVIAATILVLRLWIQFIRQTDKLQPSESVRPSRNENL